MKKQLFILISLFLLAPDANVASGYNNALHEVNSLAFGLQSSVYSNNGILDGSTELSRIGRAIVHMGHEKFWSDPATQNGITALSWLATVGEGVTLLSNIIRTGTKLITKQAVKEGLNLIPEGKLANHLFKGMGKLADNPVNRSLIQKIANGKPLGVDAYGKSWYIGVDGAGRYIYTYTQNGVIKGAGYATMTPAEIIAKYGLK